jgi:hypothetical protein
MTELSSAQARACGDRLEALASNRYLFVTLQAKEQGMIEMKGLPPKIRVVVVEPLPAHHLEALKELVGRAALRKLRQIQEGQRKAS